MKNKESFISLTNDKELQLKIKNLIDKAEITRKRHPWAQPTWDETHKV